MHRILLSVYILTCLTILAMYDYNFSFIRISPCTIMVFRESKTGRRNSPQCRASSVRLMKDKLFKPPETEFYLGFIASCAKSSSFRKCWCLLIYTFMRNFIFFLAGHIGYQFFILTQNYYHYIFLSIIEQRLYIYIEYLHIVKDII